MFITMMMILIWSQLLEDEDDNRVEVVYLTAGKVIRIDSTLHER
jgi:hypothetical protein